MKEASAGALSVSDAGSINPLHHRSLPRPLSNLNLSGSIFTTDRPSLTSTTTSGTYSGGTFSGDGGMTPDRCDSNIGGEDSGDEGDKKVRSCIGRGEATNSADAAREGTTLLAALCVARRSVICYRKYVRNTNPFLSLRSSFVAQRSSLPSCSTTSGRSQRTSMEMTLPVW